MTSRRPDLTRAQRAHLTRLSHERGPVKLRSGTGWNSGVMDRLAQLGLVTLEWRAHEEKTPGSSVATWCSDGQWASITEAGRMVAGGAR